MDSVQHIFWFGPPSLIFLKICQMVISPVRRTYNKVSTFLFSSTKKDLNYQVEPVEQYLRLLNSHSEQHIFWFGPTSLIFFNISDGYMSRQKDI